ncbi:MAG TPA: peptidoglycan editing factor PgeF [Rhodocyclaceae bacterium]|nr:peptidoglycan editing factor PgeF [Rhodocyclaceae bacterium]
MTERVPGFVPEWPMPARVRAWVTTRGTVSAADGPYAGFNLGAHVGDECERVFANRARLAAGLGCEPVWMNQVHGTSWVDLADAPGDVAADAALARRPGRACVVMSADCLPVLLCDRVGTVVAAAHAGWRGLANGVLERVVAAMGVAPGEVLAYLAPAISASHYEVGDEVRQRFVAHDPRLEAAFERNGRARFQCDLCGIARLRLAAIGVTAVFGGDECTFADGERFYSYRRDGVTGRIASLIWLNT